MKKAKNNRKRANPSSDDTVQVTKQMIPSETFFVPETFPTSSPSLENVPVHPKSLENRLEFKIPPKPSSKMSFKQRQRLLRQSQRAKREVKHEIEEIPSNIPKLRKWMFYDVPEFNQEVSTSVPVEISDKENMVEPSRMDVTSDSEKETVETSQTDIPQALDSSQLLAPTSENNVAKIIEEIEGDDMYIKVLSEVSTEKNVTGEQITKMNVTMEHEDVHDVFEEKDMEYPLQTSKAITLASYLERQNEITDGCEVPRSSDSIETVQVRSTESKLDDQGNPGTHCSLENTPTDHAPPSTFNEMEETALQLPIDSNWSNFEHLDEKNPQTISFKENGRKDEYSEVEKPSEKPSAEPKENLSSNGMETLRDIPSDSKNSLLEEMKSTALLERDMGVQTLNGIESLVAMVSRESHEEKPLDRLILKNDGVHCSESEFEQENAYTPSTHGEDVSPPKTRMERERLNTEEWPERKLEAKLTIQEPAMGSLPSKNIKDELDISKESIPSLLCNSNIKEDQTELNKKYMHPAFGVELGEMKAKEIESFSKSDSILGETQETSVLETTLVNPSREVEGVPIDSQGENEIEMEEKSNVEEGARSEKGVQEKIDDMEPTVCSSMTRDSSAATRLPMHSAAEGNSVFSTEIHPSLQAECTHKGDPIVPTFDATKVVCTNALNGSFEDTSELLKEVVTHGSNEVETIPEGALSEDLHDHMNGLSMTSEEVENETPPQQSQAQTQSSGSSLHVQEIFQEDRSLLEVSPILDMNEPRGRSTTHSDLTNILTNSMDQGAKKSEHDLLLPSIQINRPHLLNIGNGVDGLEREIYNGVFKSELTSRPVNEHVTPFVSHDPSGLTSTSSMVQEATMSSSPPPVPSEGSNNATRLNQRSIPDSMDTEAVQKTEIHHNDEDFLEPANVFAALITSDLMDVCPSHPFHKEIEVSIDLSGTENENEMTNEDELKIENGTSTDMENGIPSTTSLPLDQIPVLDVDVDKTAFTVFENRLPTVLNGSNDANAENTKMESTKIESATTETISLLLKTTSTDFEYSTSQDTENNLVGAEEDLQGDVAAKNDENMEPLQSFERSGAGKGVEKLEKHSTQSISEKDSVTIAALAAEDEVSKSTDQLDTSTSQVLSVNAVDIPGSQDSQPSKLELDADDQPRTRGADGTDFEQDSSVLQSFLSIFNQPGMPPSLEVAMHASFVTFIIILFVISYCTWGHVLSYYSLSLAVINIVIWTLTAIVNAQNRIQLASGKEKTD